MRHPLEKLDWIFYISPRAKKEGLSSGARFRPAKARKGSGWHSTTTPLMRPNKKAFVLTKDSFNELLIDLFTLLEWLRRDDFTLYLCLPGDDNKKNFHVFTGITEIHKLSQLTSFDEDKDYESLGKYCARDRVVVLDNEKAVCIKECLQKLTQPDLASNAINTTTTLYFHYYPEKITNLNELIIHLRMVADDAKENLFNQYLTLENPFGSYLIFDDWILCLYAWPKGKKKLCEIYAQYGDNYDLKIFRQYKSLLKQVDATWPGGIENLISILSEYVGENKTIKSLIENIRIIYKENNPSEEKTLVEIETQPIEILDWESFKENNRKITYEELQRYMRYFPEKRQEIWDTFKKGENNLDCSNPVDIIKAWPAGATILWDDYYNTFYENNGTETAAYIPKSIIIDCLICSPVLRPILIGQIDDFT